MEFLVFSVKQSKYTKAKINYIFDLSVHAKERCTTAKHVCLRAHNAQQVTSNV